MQIGMNDIKNGITIELDGEVYSVVEFKHVKPGKGGAFMRTKLKNLKTGAIIDKTLRSNDKVEVAYIEKKNIQYLYSSKDSYEFMVHDTYDEISLYQEQLGEVINYLKENMEVAAIVYKNEIIGIETPTFVDLRIVSTEPGIRGDTSRAGTKPARTETGMTISVPLFINEDDVVRIDTRTGEYAGRA